MSMSDPIADMLTRIRNATRNRAKAVTVLNSKVNVGIAQVLQAEGYINEFEVNKPDNRQGTIDIALKYGPRGEVILHEIKRESRPGRRVYRGVGDIPQPMQGLGISIVSTSRGVMSGRKCMEEKVGGELLATVI